MTANAKKGEKNLNRNVSMNSLTIDKIKHLETISNEIVLLFGLNSITTDEMILLGQLIDNANVKAIIPLNCSTEISQFGRYGTIAETKLDYKPDIINQIYLVWENLKQSERFKHIEKLNESKIIVTDLWKRKSSDDLLFLILYLIDTFTDTTVNSIQAVTSTSNSGLKEVLYYILKRIIV